MPSDFLWNHRILSCLHEQWRELRDEDGLFDATRRAWDITRDFAAPVEMPDVDGFLIKLFDNLVSIVR